MTATATKAAVTGDRQRKPASMPVNVAGIPDALKFFDRWLVWRWEWTGTKWSKPPKDARTGRPASSTGSDTWCRFDEALAAQQAGRVDGIGFALGEADGGLHFAGIDLDDSRDPQTGEIADWALAIIRLVDSYTEVSPSRAGLKILFLGKLPKCARKVGNIECYDSGRYFTLTGHTLDAGPTKLRDATREVEQFCAQYMTPPPANESGLSDSELAAAALRALSPHRADDYFLWIQVGMAARAAGVPLAEWETWSASSSKYVAGECARKWESFGRGSGLGIGSLIFWAKQDGWQPPARAKAGFRLTDMGNAERFAAQHGADVRYCHSWKRWLTWDGRRWCIDDSGEVERRAKLTVRSVYREASECGDSDQAKALAKHAGASERRERLNAMISLAASEKPIPVAVDSLDAEPWLLNCENGTIDLRTGELREHRREDFLTKICPVEFPTEAGVDAELWTAFLDRIFDGNAALIGFVQKLMGMAIVGEVQEHVLPIFFGAGANGKSVFIETVVGMLGQDYAMNAPAALLMASKGDRHPTELADLHGKRFVAAVETADGGRLSEALVKELTGGDSIRARRMREDFWQFRPSHTVVLATNHKPIIRGADHGVWRRIKLIPFTVTIPDAEQDKQLTTKLRTEWPAILRWCVSGCLAWQRSGLQPPDEVSSATNDYRSDMDILGTFIAERCIEGPQCEARAKDLYREYKHWAEDRGEFVESQTRFGSRLADRGLTKIRLREGVRWRGIGVLPLGGEQCV